MGVVIVSPRTGLCQENRPLSYVSLVRATYTLLSGRLQYKLGRARSCSNSNLLRGYSMGFSLKPETYYIKKYYIDIFAWELVTDEFYKYIDNNDDKIAKLILSRPEHRNKFRYMNYFWKECIVFSILGDNTAMQ